jgi:hypothetical protein
MPLIERWLKWWVSAFLMFPLSSFRSGVLRQGFDKFYSLGSQAIPSLFVFS